MRGEEFYCSRAWLILCSFLFWTLSRRDLCPFLVGEVFDMKSKNLNSLYRRCSRALLRSALYLTSSLVSLSRVPVGSTTICYSLSLRSTTHGSLFPSLAKVESINCTEGLTYDLTPNRGKKYLDLKAILHHVKSLSELLIGNGTEFARDSRIDSTNSMSVYV